MAKPRNDYFKKLQDPRWQRVKSDVQARADFQCEFCDDDKSTLHIHHGYYEWGLDPWEYPLDSLTCLCETCHAKADELRKSTRRMVGKLSMMDTHNLLGYAKALWAINHEDTPDARIRIGDAEEAEGVAVAYGVRGYEVINLAIKDKNGWVSVGQLQDLEAETIARKKAQKCRA